ncbi:class I SAM-dependent methyltransferase [Bacteroidota bacterium]
MDYNNIYKKYPSYFGTVPDKLLVKFYDKIIINNPVLDIGAGQGRNGLFLAGKGFKVEMLDQSHTAVESIKKVAAETNFTVKVIQSNFEDFNPGSKIYSAILVFGIIQESSHKSIDQLINKIDLWTNTGSMVFITAFSTLDPACQDTTANWKNIGKNSFTNAEGEIKTFLEPDEVLNLFKKFQVVYHWEGLGPGHTHSDGLTHCHGRIEAVLKKK